jgi:tryptophan synthase beta chain
MVEGGHAARFAAGTVGVLQGTRSFILQNVYGNIDLTHSIAPGLDYAAVGPEHSYLRDMGRAEYTHVSDEQALGAFQELSRLEGIMPALESAHAVAHAIELSRSLKPSQRILVNLSGRGDKDVNSVAARLNSANEPRTG